LVESGINDIITSGWQMAIKLSKTNADQVLALIRARTRKNFNNFCMSLRHQHQRGHAYIGIGKGVCMTMAKSSCSAMVGVFLLPGLCELIASFVPLEHEMKLLSEVVVMSYSPQGKMQFSRFLSENLTADDDDDDDDDEDDDDDYDEDNDEGHLSVPCRTH
jgi:hypothetical protein